MGVCVAVNESEQSASLSFIKDPKVTQDLPPINGSLALLSAINVGLYELQEYYSCMERILQSTLDWKVTGLKKRSEHLPESKRQEYIEYNYPYRWELSFINQSRAATIVSSVSFLESILLSVCKEAAIRFNVRFVDPKKNWLGESRAFL